MKLIKNFLDFLVVIPLFIFGFFKILLYFKKINLAETIIIQNRGGFGYTFTTPDIMRNFYRNKNFLCGFMNQLGTIFI